MTEKPCPKIDEIRDFKENFENLKKQHPETVAKRMAKIDFLIISLMFEDAFYNGKFHFYDQQKIAKQLRKFRPDLTITDEEITCSLERCTKRKRLYNGEFMSDFLGLVMKWVYNVNYTQPPEKSLDSQTLTKPPAPPYSGEPNPFESADFRKLQDEIDKI